MSGSEIYRLAENMERKAKKVIKDLKKTLNLDAQPQVNEAEQIVET